MGWDSHQPVVAATGCGGLHGLLVGTPSTPACLLPLQRFDSLCFVRYVFVVL